MKIQLKELWREIPIIFRIAYIFAMTAALAFFIACVHFILKFW